MPYRVRPINWELMTNPISQGLQMETQASGRLGALIAGAGQDVGQGMVRSRNEKESKRRFDINTAQEQQSFDLRKKLGEGELSLRQQEFDLRKGDRALNESMLVEGVREASDLMNVQHGATGQVDPKLAEGFQRLVDANGGPQATAEKIGKSVSLADWQGATDRSEMLPPPGSERYQAISDYEGEDAAKAFSGGGVATQTPPTQPTATPPVAAPPVTPSAPTATSLPGLTPAAPRVVSDAGKTWAEHEALANEAQRRLDVSTEIYDRANKALQPGHLHNAKNIAELTMARNDAFRVQTLAAYDLRQNKFGSAQAKEREVKLESAAAKAQEAQAKDVADSLQAMGKNAAEDNAPPLNSDPNFVKGYSDRQAEMKGNTRQAGLIQARQEATASARNEEWDRRKSITDSSRAAFNETRMEFQKSLHDETMDAGTKRAAKAAYDASLRDQIDNELTDAKFFKSQYEKITKPGKDGKNLVGEGQGKYSPAEATKFYNDYTDHLKKHAELVQEQESGRAAPDAPAAAAPADAKAAAVEEFKASGDKSPEAWAAIKAKHGIR